ncbi:hypothetical protein AMAG_12820 [Allomyces macrogynus ATCC 38327]|uniref:Uncharacterized protein n=1 Tax=Allomyces macrogynus (strain ATCC 38327) TaxID=578462 RepID=A0A0L0T1F5_ALLM3|nr:hypothetical protein AMAG_12820 [Allomyces macrogynus ATCC 38327]|eukprot:KNE68653.1 hypothetical protein AMAG_12820 [Allomyces macrogynus ATCC 38327]
MLTILDLFNEGTEASFTEMSTARCTQGRAGARAQQPSARHGGRARGHAGTAYSCDGSEHDVGRGSWVLELMRARTEVGQPAPSCRAKRRLSLSAGFRSGATRTINLKPPLLTFGLAARPFCFALMGSNVIADMAWCSNYECQ